MTELPKQTFTWLLEPIIERCNFTIEEVALSAEEITSRIKKVIQNYPWLVYEKDDGVLGYTYAVRWKERFKPVIVIYL